MQMWLSILIWGVKSYMTRYNFIWLLSQSTWWWMNVLFKPKTKKEPLWDRKLQPSSLDSIFTVLFQYSLTCKNSYTIPIIPTYFNSLTICPVITVTIIVQEFTIRNGNQYSCNIIVLLDLTLNDENTSILTPSSWIIRALPTISC